MRGAPRAEGIAVDRAADVSLHEQIGRQLRERIRRGEMRPGQKLPSVRALCRSCNISMNTAQRVFDDLARAGLVESRHGSGTFVAHRRATRTTELLLPGYTPTVDRWVEALSTQLRDGIREGFRHDPSRRVLTTFDHDDCLIAQEVVETARSRGADSVIVYCTPYNNMMTQLVDIAASVACIAIGTVIPGSQLDSVTVSPDEAVRAMLTARLDRGGRHFAYVGGQRPVMQPSPYYAYGRACSAFRDRLAEAAVEPEWIVYRYGRPWGEVLPGEAGEERRRHRDRILALRPGTVVLAHTPSHAEYVVGLRGDLDVIAYTECRLTLDTFGDRVSFVYQGVEDLARAAVGLIGERLSGIRETGKVLGVQARVVEADGGGWRGGAAIE